MTPECLSAWRNYECKVDVLAAGVYLAFEAGWQAATEAAVNAALARDAPLVGHVCEGSPHDSKDAGRKPSLCWICGQALPHDCVGSHPGHRRDSRLDSDALCGCSLPPHTIAQCVARGAERLTPPITHGPPQKVEMDFAAAELRVLAEAAKHLTVAGRKWPIGCTGVVVEQALSWSSGLAYGWHYRLACAREHAKLTLAELGAKLNPPRTRKDISAMEHGRRGLSVELCAQLADVLDCDRLWLAGWTLEGAT